MGKRIYLDCAAATPVDARVLKAMKPYFLRAFGNPSSIHGEGVAAHRAVEAAREGVANAIGARRDEIVFTSGATESVTLAVGGTLRAAKMPKPHIVIAATEHDAVRKVVEASGAEVTVVPVDSEGLVRAKDVLAAVTEHTVLVCVMHANNEVGTIAPLAEIGRGIEKIKKIHATVYPLFFSDASQTVGLLDIDADKLHVDLLAFTASKIYGPKGVGALFVRRGTPIASVAPGGGQESGRRGGTENVPGIVGLAQALAIALRRKHKDAKRVARLRDVAIRLLLAHPTLAKAGVTLNGHPTLRLPGNVNVTIPGVDGEELVLRLDALGIAVSTAAACKRGTGMSHVLAAMGKSPDAIRGSLRITLGRSTRKRDVRRAVAAIAAIVKKLVF